MLRPIGGKLVFDVIEWLATLAGRPRAEITRIDEHSERGGVVARYQDGASQLATVRVTGLTGGGGYARWEVVAELRDRFVRIELPGDTRFTWTDATRDQPA